MANPTRYVQSYSFSGFQATTPQAPLPANKVDGELANIELAVSSTIDALADIRRSDGKLKNGVVTADALSPEIFTGVAPAVDWSTSTQYLVGSVVFNDTAFYRALVQHTSAVFSTDFAAGYWIEFADLGPVGVAAGDARDQAVASASAAAASASNAAASASAASGSASSAAASASTALGAISGTVTQAVRHDLAQGLSGAAQLQARQNIGITSNGSSIVTGATPAGVVLAVAADVAAQRAALATTIGAGLMAAADSVAGRTLLAAAPSMQTASGVGQIVGLNSTAGNGVSAPAGGTWAGFHLGFTSGALASGMTVFVVAGGATIVSGSPGVVYCCFAWRIA